MDNEIKKAAEALPGHWYQGDYTDFKGNYCGIGHVLKAYGLSDESIDEESLGSDTLSERFDKQIRVLNEVVREQFPERTDFIAPFPTFNDHPDTTEDEVLTILEKAAVKWDEQVD